MHNVRQKPWEEFRIVLFKAPETKNKIKMKMSKNKNKKYNK